MYYHCFAAARAARSAWRHRIRGERRAGGRPPMTDLEHPIAAAAASWTGLCFRLAGQDLAAPGAEVEEVLPLPRLTPVPGCRPWLLGLAAAGGRLLCVADLERLLRGAGEPGTRAARVVVARSGERRGGFLVAGVSGLRELGSAPAAPPAPDWLSPWLAGGARDGGTLRGVLSLARLLRRPEYLHAIA